MSKLEALSQQLVHHVIPSIVPAALLIPSVDSMDHVLLLPSLLFLNALYKKQSHGNEVQQCCD